VPVLVCEIFREINVLPGVNWGEFKETFFAWKCQKCSDFYGKVFFRHNLVIIDDKKLKTLKFETCAELCAVQNYGITLKGLSISIFSVEYNKSIIEFGLCMTWSFIQSLENFQSQIGFSLYALKIY